MSLKRIVFEPSKTIKGTYGIEQCESGLIFYKDNIKYIDYDQDFIKKSHLKYSPLLLVDKTKNISYYEFDKDLYENTLYDTLYFNSKYWNKRKQWFKTLSNSVSQTYEIKKVNECQSHKFYSDRLDLFKASKKHSTNKDILDEVELFLKNINNYYFRAYVSNGDLTDTNICLNNKLCDTECYGYNIVICDLAIFYISILYGRWIYPKYNFGAYKFRKHRIEDCSFKINKKQADVLKRIIKLLKPIEFEYFKKFVIIRLITPISLEVIDSKDREVIDNLIKIVNRSNIKNLTKNIINYCNYYNS